MISILKRNLPTFHLIHTLWESVKGLTLHEGYTQYMPIWINPELPQLEKLEGFDFWNRAGLGFLYQLYDTIIIITIQCLSRTLSATQYIFSSRVTTMPCTTEPGGCVLAIGQHIVHSEF